jgi:hypothetical protein
MKKNLKKATPVHINIEVIKAFAADPTLCAELHNNVSNNPHSMECIGLMHTDEISLWPVSRIEEHARLIMTPTKRVISSEFVSFDFVSSRPEQLSEIPNQSPIDFLKRSGMLSEAVLRKQTGSFSLWEDLLYVATTGQSLQIDMLKAFTKITDKDTVDLIIRGLLSVNAGTLESPMDQEDVSTLLHHTFKDSPAFSQVLDSTVLKLSLLPEVIDAGYGNTYQPSALTHAVLSKPEKLLSRVANELLARPAEHLGYSEYRVFSTLLDMDIAPHVIDFDPERLLNHMLDSISTYRTSNTIICETKLFVDTCALNGLEAIAKLLMPYHTFDCSKFNDRDEASKVALIKAGFGIDRKTISRTARGQILEDEMGL